MEGKGTSKMANRKAPPGMESEAWNKLPWKKLEQHVYRIQKRIYRASQRDNQRAIHKLQKLLMKSEAARLIAVRRVTQDNQGKKTAGVDGVKSVPPKQRLVMVKQIHPKYWKNAKAKPVRRVWIPKPGKDEKRPLGIPTMLDRAKQALGKLALEPEWEARFEPNSYGFRPGRSCQDAIDAIFNSIRYKPKFVYDADIKGCFDNINQEKLLKLMWTYPAMKHAVKGWLKAGMLEGDVFAPTETGTPQGGVISPLLANIALTGMEKMITKAIKYGEKPILIRYADDFIILHSDLDVLNQATEKVEAWLKTRGLWLNPQKTRVTHTLTPHEGNVGLDFLGFTIRQFPVGKTHTGKNPYKEPLGFKTIIKPSKEAVKRHVAETKRRIKELRSRPQGQVIKELNPVIRGWSNYYKGVVSKRIFVYCDYTLYRQLRRWAVSRHPNRGLHWILKKYWRKPEGEKSKIFATPDGAKIRTHSRTEIRRHAKVKGNASPYDGDLLYWSKRLKTHPMLHGKLAKLLQLQKGACRKCELLFRDGDLIEIDHIILRSYGGKDTIDNLQALHLHCHDQRHAELAKIGVSDT
jgi:RNA-directed DNA polymerase